MNLGNRKLIHGEGIVNARGLVGDATKLTGINARNLSGDVTNMFGHLPDGGYQTRINLSQGSYGSVEVLKLLDSYFTGDKAQIEGNVEVAVLKILALDLLNPDDREAYDPGDLVRATEEHSRLLRHLPEVREEHPHLDWGAFDALYE